MKKSHLLLVGFLSVGMLFSCKQKEEAVEQEVQVETSGPATGPEREVKVDLDKSTVKWAGTMVGVYTHTGTVKLTEGTIKVAGEKLLGGRFKVDMSTITPNDKNYDKEKTPEKLAKHLSSPDFFDVAKYPEATFEITGAEGNTVKGNLTIRGNTHEETVEDVSFNNETKVISGKMTFDRTKYDVSYKPAQEMILSNDVKLDIQLVTME